MDWLAAKTEYIATNTSYRKLAAKYGVNYSVLSGKAREEGWVELREQYRAETHSKMLGELQEQQISRAGRLQSVADKLLMRVEELVEDESWLIKDTQSLKHLSGVLKDIKDVQMIRSDADMREQEARIAKLRRENEADRQEGAQIIVTLAGAGEESWNE